MEIPKVIKIGTDNVWNIFELQKEWPVMNKGWERFYRRYVYRVQRRDGLLSVKTDPWNRPFIPWTSDVTELSLDWVRDHGEPEEIAVSNGTKRYYRYVTVAGKAVKLQVIIL
jgi:hypothetical protein